MVGAKGITETLQKISMGIREGITENAELVKDLLAAIIERKFTLRCPKVLLLSTVVKPSRKAFSTSLEIESLLNDAGCINFAI